MNERIKYDPQIHHCKSTRLKGYDYSGAGEYFITLCCHNNRCSFGIENDEIKLNDLGKIAYDEWANLPERFLTVQVDVFQIMPNHIHGIITINEPANMNPVFDSGVFNTGEHTNPVNAGGRAGAGPAPTVGNIVGAYKSLVSNACLKIFKSNNQKMGKLWQRDYYEHIIRNEQSYQTIANYIMNNPVNWNDDKFFV